MFFSMMKWFVLVYVLMNSSLATTEACRIAISLLISDVGSCTDARIVSSDSLWLIDFALPQAHYLHNEHLELKQRIVWPREMSECFICRDVELQASDPLRNFCDCKNLLAHHVCLSTWIQKGCGSEDRLRCIICKAKYQLQRSSPWRSVSFQWRTWLVLITVFVLLGLVPFVVYCMMTAFTNPPPPITFKVAAASFGLLTEILLIKSLSSYLSSRYRQAEQSSFTVRPRGFDEDRTRTGCWDQSEVPAVAGHA